MIKPNVGQRRSAREKAAVNYGVDTVNSSDDLDLMDEDDEEKEEDSEVGVVASREEINYSLTRRPVYPSLHPWEQDERISTFSCLVFFVFLFFCFSCQDIH